MSSGFDPRYIGQSVDPRAFMTKQATRLVDSVEVPYFRSVTDRILGVAKDIPKVGMDKLTTIYGLAADPDDDFEEVADRLMLSAANSFLAYDAERLLEVAKKLLL